MNAGIKNVDDILKIYEKDWHKFFNYRSGIGNYLTFCVIK